MISAENEYSKLGILSGSTIKILACIFMAFDHAGAIFFSDLTVFRAIGRLAFPLFAYFIAEGCKYTKNKLKRFLTVFIIGAMYILFYLIYAKEVYCNVFITFSISILLIYLWTWFKKYIFDDRRLTLATLSLLGIIALGAATWFLSENVYLEYGFKGAILPLLISLFDFKDMNAPSFLKRLDNHYVALLCMALGLSLLCINANLGEIQLYSFLSVALLLLYNGKVGNKKMKYAFYIFYPAHLVIIEGISIIISLVR